MKSTSEYMRSSAENHMLKLKVDRHLRKANWSTVAEYLPKELKLVEDIDEASMTVAKIAEHRRLILEKEKSAYWKQFKDGMLSASAVRTLTDTVNDILDDKGAQSLSHRKDLELLWQPPKWLSTLQSVPVFGKITENAFFERLAVSSDCAVGFIAGQEECLKLLESMYRAEDKSERPNLELIEQEINENIISGQTFVRNLRNTYPEIYRSIATRQAIRSVLNYELHTVSRLRSKGRLDGGEAAKMTVEIEARMKQLLEKPPSIKLPETGELLQAVSWVKDLDKDLVKKLTNLCQTKIYSNGQVIMKAKSTTQGMFIIARGNVKILEGTELIELIGKGHVLGQKSILGDRATRYSGVCETPVTALWAVKRKRSEAIGGITSV